MALTKADLAEHLFTDLGLSKRDAKEMVESFFEEIRLALEQGEQVKISGFGNFELRNKGERPGRNPKTGEDIPISARRVVTFRPGQKLKARVESIEPPNASSAFTPLRRPMTFSTKIIGIPITNMAIQNKNTYAPPPFSPTKYGKRHVAPKPTVAPATLRI